MNVHQRVYIANRNVAHAELEAENAKLREENAELRETVAYLNLVIDGLQAINTDAAVQLARVRHQAAAIIEAARPRIANGNGTA